MKPYINQKGVSIIAAVFIIVILAFMGVMFVSLIGTGSLTAVNDLQSSQALYLAEGGVEYALGNRTFPNYSVASTNLGAGKFQVDTPAYLTVALLNNNAATVDVNSTAGFPASGRIVVGTEIISYTALSPTQFSGGARRQGGTARAPHAIGDAVYPVTYVNGTNVAVGDTSVTVVSTGRFVIPGVIKIDNEDIYCTTATATQFTNCIRGYHGSVPAAHNAGNTRNVYQFSITSTGTVGNAKRTLSTQIANQTLITFDASSWQTTGGSSVTNSISWNHTVSGDDPILLVGVSIGSTQNVSTITYGGVSLHRINVSNNANGVHAELWDLVNNPILVGTHTITVTLAGNAPFVAGAVSLNGALQTADPSNSQISSGNSMNPIRAINTAVNYSWVVDTLAVLTASTNVTVNAIQTQQWSASTIAPAIIVTGAGSTQADLTASAVTMSWNTNVNAQWALVVAEVRVAPSAENVFFWQEVVN
jgi:hypothetical protein